MSENQSATESKQKMFTELSEVKGRKILVVGLGRTGVSLAKLLQKHGAQVTVSDHKSKAELVSFLEKMEGVDVNYDLGGHTPSTFLEQEIVIVSPGVPTQLKVFDYIRSAGVHVTGELEFVSQFVKEPVIAVTGSNGKTTTAYLIREFLKASKVKSWIGGSYGAPLSQYLYNEQKADVVIVEVSSAQLEFVETFCPKTIVFTNLSLGHLDRHADMETYVKVKKCIFSNINRNGVTVSVLNADDNMVVDFARDQWVRKGCLLYFSSRDLLYSQIMHIGGAISNDKSIQLKLNPEAETEHYSLENFKSLGKHNVENAVGALLAARTHGASVESVSEVLGAFRGLPHRLEYVRKVGGVKFYNDSKSTNVESVARALDCFEGNVILIMGGKHSGLDYASLNPVIKERVRALILVGENKEKLNRDVGDSCNETHLMGTFEESVLMAFQKVVLEIPFCCLQELQVLIFLTVI